MRGGGALKLTRAEPAQLSGVDRLRCESALSFAAGSKVFSKLPKPPDGATKGATTDMRRGRHGFAAIRILPRNGGESEWLDGSG